MLILVPLISLVSVISSQFADQLFDAAANDIKHEPIVQQFIKPLGPDSIPPEFNRKYKPAIKEFVKPLGPDSIPDQFNRKFRNKPAIKEFIKPVGPDSIPDEYNRNYGDNENDPGETDRNPTSDDSIDKDFEDPDNVPLDFERPQGGNSFRPRTPFQFNIGGSAPFIDYNKKYGGPSDKGKMDNEPFNEDVDVDPMDFDVPPNENMQDPFDSKTDPFVKPNTDDDNNNNDLVVQENNQFPSRCPFNKNIGTSFNYKWTFTLRKSWNDKNLDKSTNEYQSIREKIHLQTLLTYVDNFEYIDSLLLQLENKYNKTRATVVLRFTKNEQNADILWRSIKCCFSDCGFFDNKDFEIMPISNDNVAELCVGMCANAYAALSNDICIDNCPAQCCSMQSYLNLYSNNQLPMTNPMCPSFCEFNCMPNACPLSCCSRMGMKRNLLEKNNVLNQKSIGKLNI